MYYIGIDLGGTNIAAGLVNEEFEIVEKCSIPTGVKDGVNAIVDRMAQAAHKVAEMHGITMDEVACIGIGSPGVVDNNKKEVSFAANLGFLHTPVVKMLEDRIPGKKICIGNDADVAAYGEYKAGAAKNIKDCMTITLGTGVGGGLIINGEIYNGFNHAGGEFGHIAIHEGGRPCTCGRKGCWEAYASVTGLIKTTVEMMEKHPESLMWEIAGGNTDNVNGLTSFDAMRRGDPTAKEVVAEYVRGVAAGLTDVINIIQPEVLCIGGGISKEGETLLGPVREIVEREMFARHSETHTELRIAKLGNDAGIIGAALLGM